MNAPDQYERNMAAWVAQQLEDCPPLNERQKQLIRTAFAAHRTDQSKGVAA